jgi:hypothetical protein
LCSLNQQIFGSDILANFGLRADWFYADILALCGFTVFFLFAGFMFLLPPSSEVKWTGMDRSISEMYTAMWSEHLKADGVSPRTPTRRVISDSDGSASTTESQLRHRQNGDH